MTILPHFVLCINLSHFNAIYIFGYTLFCLIDYYGSRDVFVLTISKITRVFSDSYHQLPDKRSSLKTLNFFVSFEVVKEPTPFVFTDEAIIQHNTT